MPAGGGFYRPRDIRGRFLAKGQPVGGSATATIRENERAMRRAIDNLNKVIDAAKIGGAHGLNRLAVEIVSDIRGSMKPGTGRVYRRKSVVHRASAPGRPPAVDTGRLRASYTWVPGIDSRGNHYVDVGTNSSYAPPLEYGTYKMAPRPHFRPALDRATARTMHTYKAILASEKATIRKLKGLR